MAHYTFEKFVGGTALALSLVLMAGSGAKAEETPPPFNQQQVGINDAADGTLLFKTQTPGRYIKAPMVSTDVVMDIAGPVIRTRLSQTFENTSDEWVEGIYVFPLPEYAAVDHLKMIIGGRMIEGQIHEKKKAKQIYEQAKSEGKKASLVEQERPNIFTASVANIGPGEKIAIQIEYQDKAQMKGGVFSARFPMTVGPRYNPQAQTIQIASNRNEPIMAVLDPVLDRARIEPPLMNPINEPDNYLRLPVTMTINLNAGFDLDTVTSPYHDIQIAKIDEDSVQIQLADGKVPANKDFKLEWQAQPTAQPYSGLFRETVGGDTYLLAMLTPPKPNKQTLKTHARESIFVIDTSGSMDGKSIVQARKSLLLALDHLDAKDTFNIIRFSSDHSSLFPQAQLANDKNIAKARRFVRGLEAGGGTEMAPALAQALEAQDRESGRVRQVMFITDGSIGNEKQLFAQIKDNLKTSRLFPVGIGSAPNSYFMSRAAKFGRGTYVQIGDLNEVSQRMGTLFAALDNPVLTNLSANLETKGQSYPSYIPDLYEGEPVIMVTKLSTKNLPQNIKLDGRLASTDWAASFPMSNINEAKGLSVLWAREKIASLEESRFDRAGADKIDAQILQTALEHHIVSRLTSLVAVDITPSRPLSADLTQSQVPTQLPEGWNFAKVAFDGTPQAQKPMPVQRTAPAPQPSVPLPSTASPHVIFTLLGLLLMLIGALFPRLRTRRS